jgi:subtilisin-like proprotein convertase family protein
MRKLIVLFIVLFLGSGFFGFAGNADSFIAKKDDGKKYDRLSILVKFRDGVTKDQRKEVLKLVDGRIKDKNKDGKDDRFKNILNGNLAKIELKKSKKKDMAAEALTALRNHPYLECAELNYILTIDAIPNDASFDQLWGMHNTGQTGGTADADIDAPEAWDITTGSYDIVVGVIDTGIDYNHPDLAANVWTNPAEIPNNGVDDDNNGYIDDVHGINSITGSGDPMDDHYHGTHCAGSIGAVGNDGYGVVGVCWNVKIIGMKFLDSQGSGSTADAIECIDYSIGLVNSGVNLKVLSNSYGGGGYEQIMVDAIEAAKNAGILFVAAAGNDGDNADVTPHYPSSYSNTNIVSVAATDHNDGLAYFSTYGLTTVDLGAPGVDIKSTYPNNSYGTISGTSMATPHVAGAAALVLSYNDTLTLTELKTILMDSGDTVSSLAGKTVSSKRLNVFNALNQTPSPGPSFALNASPSAQIISQTQTASYTIDIQSILGFVNPVDFTYTSTPPINANVTFTTNPGTPGSSVVMDVVTSASTTLGDYIIEVTGTSAGITKTTTVNLQVNPDNLVQKTYIEVANMPIPDNNPTGINSSYDVPDAMTIWNASVTVNITHTWQGDLVVKLISPAGTEIVLHDREGSSIDDIHQTYDITSLRGEDCAGVWTLHVSDNALIDEGTLDDWTLDIEGSPTGGSNYSPEVTISSPTDGSNFSPGDPITFTGVASDYEDGDLTSSIQWSSSLDGNIGTGGQFTTSGLSYGTHVVKAAVTDSGGKVAEYTINVAVGDYLSLSYTNDTPVPIPDRDFTGIFSTINVPDSVSIDVFSVEINIDHTWIGDLVVKLVSPTGTEVILHNMEGSMDDNIYKTYYPTEYLGENCQGEWTLQVSDYTGMDIGTLNYWTLNIEGAPY